MDMTSESCVRQSRRSSAKLGGVQCDTDLPNKKVAKTLSTVWALLESWEEKERPFPTAAPSGKGLGLQDRPKGMSTLILSRLLDRRGTWQSSSTVGFSVEPSLASFLPELPCNEVERQNK